MITTINEDDFIKAFKEMGREKNFTYEGLQELFKYYEEYEDSTGETVELDVIAICCDWTEYESNEELLSNYDRNYTFTEIMDNTTVLKASIQVNPDFQTHYIVNNF